MAGFLNGLDLPVKIAVGLALAGVVSRAPHAIGIG